MANFIIQLGISICALCWLRQSVYSFKVSYELDDRFVDYRKDAKWLVMFYAPWCHHCHKLEPIWEQVAQTFNQGQSDLGLRVGKVDATKQAKCASEFRVKGYPTIKYIHGDQIVSYDGERTREDIEEFVFKAIGPPVRKITGLSELRAAETRDTVFFLYISAGPAHEDLREQYGAAAQDRMFTSYFYETDSRLASGNVPYKTAPAVAVFKDNRYIVYDETEPLTEWINQEQLASFPKISGGNFYQLIALKKLIAIAVVEFVPYRNTMAADAKILFDVLNKIAVDRKPHLNDRFSFGYLDGNEIINSVTSQWIDPPALVVYEPDQEIYFIMDPVGELVSVQLVEHFLEQILTGELQGVGGKGWFRKSYKFVYSISSYFYKMFSTQPILSSILFGLPLGILGIILVMMYTNDCTDASEEGSDSEHEKEE